MSSSVLALDLDVTKAGVALPSGRTITLHAPTINTKRHGPGEIGRRLAWWRHQLGHLTGTYRPQYLVIEAAIPTPGHTSTVRKAEVHAVARLVAHDYGAHLIDDIYPSELKKTMAGHGNADKAAMTAAAITLGADPANDDEADAALLRYMVLDILQGPDALRRWLTSQLGPPG